MNNLDAYPVILQEYPDILNIEDMSRLLDVSQKTVYKLLRENQISAMKVGRAYRIPKLAVIEFLLCGNEFPRCYATSE